MRLSKVDPNSYSTPETVIIKHADLDWTVNFENNVIIGSALLHFEVVSGCEIEEILLDVSTIDIKDVSVKSKAGEIPLTFDISDLVENIGSKLTIYLPTKTSGKLNVLINYETSSKASALCWLNAEQTFSKKHSYLFSQCQAIHARSILPCQDTPAVKFTYNAVLHHPKEVTGLMSAIRVKSEEGATYFEQKTPIPSYLLAIVVGALVSKEIGPISSVWAEEGQVDAAAFEFSETDTFLKKAEEICGPYVWKRYDLLVMPPSFPFGGMENPCLTFVTPTLLAGDRSLASVVAHEIAHSWTGNLVTNKNFEHFWLNEGFTVFVEHKIVGRINGAPYRDFYALHGLSDLADNIKNQLANEPELTKLIVDLSNLSPDDAFSSIPYMKGSTFLRYIEDVLGGPEVFEPFLKFYLNKYKYQSIITDDFKKTLYDYFSKDQKYEEKLAEIDWDCWLFGEGMPPVIPNYDKSLAEACHKHADLWSNNSLDMIKASPLLKDQLSSTQLIEFLQLLLEKKNFVELNGDKLAILASNYKIEASKNSEIRFRLDRLYIKARLFDKMDEILEFLNSNFRMKYCRPLYRDLAGWDKAKPIAVENFKKIKDQMMIVCAHTVAKDLGLTN